MNLSVAVPAELEAFVKAKVDSGAYADEGEVVNDALRRLQREDEWLLSDAEKRTIRQKIDIGWESAKAGRLLTPEQLKADLEARKQVWKQEHGLA